MLGNFGTETAQATPQDKNSVLAWLDAATNTAITSLGGTVASIGSDLLTLAEIVDTKVANDDPRLSNAREWIAATVEQSEAELGIGTDRRAWTALRVRQSARVNPDFDPTGNIFTIGTTAASQRIRLRRRFASAGDFSQLSIDFSGNDCRIQTQQAGNTPNPLCLGTNGVDRVFLSATSTQLGIGGSPTTRPLEIFAGTAGFRLQSSSAVSPPVYTEIARTFDFLTWQDSTSPFNTCTDLVANSNQFNNHSLRVFVHTSGVSNPVLHSVFHSSGRLLVGTDIDNGTDRLQVNGGVNASRAIIDTRLIGPSSPGDYFAWIGTGNVGWSFGDRVVINTEGSLGATGASVSLGASQMLGWTNTVNNGRLVSDTKIGRASAGVVGVYLGNGTTLGGLTSNQLTIGGSGSATSPLIFFNGAGTGNEMGLYRAGFDLVASTQGVPVFHIGYTRGAVVVRDALFGISSAQLDATSSVDTRWSRASAGVWRAGTTANNALGSVELANLTASGNVNLSVSGTILWGTFTGLQGIGDEDLVVRRSSVGTERVRFQPVGVTVANDGGFRFSSTVSATGTVNLALRSNAGVLEINNGTLGSLRDLSLRNITASGTITSAFQTLSTDPSTIDIGTGLHRVVKNTTSGEVRDWVNDGGVMKKSPAYT